MLARVLSSKVGPNPPVVRMNWGLRFKVSLIVFAVSLISSGMFVTRLTVIPSTVACFDSHCALVLTTLPISSSLPMHIISMS